MSPVAPTSPCKCGGINLGGGVVSLPTVVLSLAPVGEGESAPLVVGGELVPALLLLSAAAAAAAVAAPPNNPTLRLFCAEAVVATEKVGCYSSERQPGCMRTSEFTEGEGGCA